MKQGTVHVPATTYGFSGPPNLRRTGSPNGRIAMIWYTDCSLSSSVLGGVCVCANTNYIDI